MAKVGFCAPNGSFDLAEMARCKPPGILLMESQAGAIPDIRRELPGCRILLRMEAGGLAWDPPNGLSAEQYAARVAEVANRYTPDVIIPWNEANLEWQSYFPDASNPTREQYERLGSFAARFIRAYRTLSHVLVAFPALSPGHHEDDDPGDLGWTAAEILRETAALYDELHLHNYWTPEAGSVGSEWFGRRWTRQIVAWAWTKPWAITEFNREFNRDDAQDVARLADEIRQFAAGIPSYIQTFWFIFDSPDQSFRRLTIRGVDGILNTIRSINEGAAMSSVLITTTPIGPAVVGKPHEFEVTVTADEIPLADCLVSAMIHFPLRKDGLTAFATDVVLFNKTDANGATTFRWNVPTAFDEGPVDGSIQLNSYTFSHGEFLPGFLDVPLHIVPQAPMPSPIPGPIDLPNPNLPPVLDEVWRIAGDVVNAGLAIQNAIRRAKGESVDPK